jgi:hypothetical protein
LVEGGEGGEKLAGDFGRVFGGLDGCVELLGYLGFRLRKRPAMEAAMLSVGIRLREGCFE